MNKLPTPQENPDGLHSKYKIEHTDGSPIDPGAVYFVLRLDSFCHTESWEHIEACRKAAYKYCESIRESDLPTDHTLQRIAKDLFNLLMNT